MKLINTYKHFLILARIARIPLNIEPCVFKQFVQCKEINDYPNNKAYIHPNRGLKWFI